MGSIGKNQSARNKNEQRKQKIFDVTRAQLAMKTKTNVAVTRVARHETQTLVDQVRHHRAKDYNNADA